MYTISLEIFVKNELSDQQLLGVSFTILPWLDSFNTRKRFHNYSGIAWTRIDPVLFQYQRLLKTGLILLFDGDGALIAGINVLAAI